MTLAELDFPTIEALAAMGVTGAQFVDLVRWMASGRKRWGDGWIRRVHPITGWEVLSFIRENERQE
jgi:hypothetical protein